MQSELVTRHECVLWPGSCRAQSSTAALRYVQFIGLQVGVVKELASFFNFYIDAGLQSRSRANGA